MYMVNTKGLSEVKARQDMAAMSMIFFRNIAWIYPILI